MTDQEKIKKREEQIARHLRWLEHQKYNHNIKPPHKDNQKEIASNGTCNYIDRQEWYFSIRKRTCFCKDCEHSQDNMQNKCTKCGSTNIKVLSIDARVPKRGNKRKMKNFRRHFVD